MENLNNESGRSMIEMLGVLAIIGVLSVGGIAGYSKAMMKYKINKTIEQITLIAGNVRAFFAPQRNYSGFAMQNGCGSGCQVVVKAKLLPDEMLELKDDGNFKQANNEFGGTILGSSEHRNSYGDSQAFSLSFSSIPLEACIELASQDWTILGQTIVGINKCSGCGGHCTCSDKYFLPPMSVDEAVDACNTPYNITFTIIIDVNPSSTYWQSKINPSS